MAVSGPLIVNRCATIEIKDLADCLNFDQPGNEETVYGFKINADGLYERTEVTMGEKITLSQIKDLDARESADSEKHMIEKRGPKWVLVPFKEIPGIEWDIIFEFKSPYTLISNDQTFKKSINQMAVLVSLVPYQENVDRIAVKPHRKNKYLIYKAVQGSDKFANCKVLFAPEVALGNRYTILINALLKRGPANYDFLKGVNISWSGEVADDTAILIAIKKNGRDVQATSTVERVTLSISNLQELKFIDLKYLQLTSFYFIYEVLSDSDVINFHNKINGV